MKLIIYKILESGEATGGQYSSTCPDGWKSIKLDAKIRKIKDVDWDSLHEQKYIDYMGSIDYIKNRLSEYPSIGDQLDYIFHNGVDKWKADIVQPVKDKFPKPNLE